MGSALLRKGAHDKRLRTAKPTQAALDGAGATLLTIWPELMVEALGVIGSIYRHSGTAFALLFDAPLVARSRG
jgi:hypothetical protein